MDTTLALPVFVQIAQAVVRDIRRGRLARGARLPGSRELARVLGVHRNTVLAAFAELEQEGWLHARKAQGTFVAESLPEAKPRRFSAGLSAPGPRSVLDLPPLPPATSFELPSNALPLLGGLPDPRLMPTAELARAYRRAIARTPGALSYGSPRGEPRLVAALRELLRLARGVVAAEDEILVTRGSQMALFLAARAICRPGDRVAVEALGYAPAWEALRLAGAELVPIPVDRGGIRLQELGDLTAAGRLAAVYVTPHHQYPTTVTMTAGRRLELLALAEQRRFLVLEDDYDHEFHWSGRPVLPLASADPARVVVYVGTLSKVLAPGLRIGYLAGRAEIVERALRLRCFVDRQGDHVVESAVADFIEEGELERHTRRARRAYLERREALVEALGRELGAELDFELPKGGLALWARVRIAMGVERWAERALSRGVVIQTARHFSFDRRPRNYVRLGFPALDPSQIQKAVRLLAAASRDFAR